MRENPWRECKAKNCEEACERIRIEGPSVPHFPRSDGLPKKGEYSFHLFPSDYHPSGLCYYHLVKSQGWFDAKFPLHKHFQERPFDEFGGITRSPHHQRSFWKPLK